MSTFRSLLLDIGQQLTTNELSSLKYACSDFIPAGRAESIDKPHLLFLEMERQDKLSENSKQLLADLLVQIGRIDLKNKFLGIQEERTFQPLHQRVPYPDSLTKKKTTHKIITQMRLAEKISISWKYVGRYLGVDEFALNNIEDTYRRTEERSMQMLNKWMQASSDTSIGRLSTALKHAGRTDLAEALQEHVMSLESFDMRPLGDALPDGGQQGRRQPQELDNVTPAATNSTNTAAERGGHTRTSNENDEITSQAIQVVQDPEDSKKGSSFCDETRYTVVDLLGSGAFAKVYFVMDKTTQEKFAVKVIDYGMNLAQQNFDELKRTINLLRGLNSSYIIKYYKTDPVKDVFAFYMEYMPGGSIADLIKNGGPIEETQVRKYTWQILNALQYLHESKVIHRNIKGSNVLVDKEHKLIKLTDYGISHAIEGIATSSGNWYNGMTLSVYWTSPELLCSERYTFNTDIWSLGCTIVEMLTGDPPLKAQKLSAVQVMYKISHYDIQPSDECSSIAKDFLDYCFKKRDERPSTASLLDSEHFAFPLYDDF